MIRMKNWSQDPVNKGTVLGDSHHCPPLLERLHSGQLEGSPMKQTFASSIDAPTPGRLRNPLPPVAISALRAIQATKVYPKGFEFFLEGQSPVGLYVLYAGCVELSVTDSHARQMVLGSALPGDILGLSAVISGKYYEETAVAAVPSQAGFIKSQDFLHFLSHHSEAAFWVVQLLSDRVTTTLDQLSCISRTESRHLRQ